MRGAAANAGSSGDRLSDQERKILPLIAEGKTNRQIAASLYLSEHTVKTYVSSLLKKAAARQTSRSRRLHRQATTSSRELRLCSARRRRPQGRVRCCRRTLNQADPRILTGMTFLEVDTPTRMGVPLMNTLMSRRRCCRPVGQQPGRATTHHHRPPRRLSVPRASDLDGRPTGSIHAARPRAAPRGDRRARPRSVRVCD